jgi:hypothetical protein
MILKDSAFSRAYVDVYEVVGILNKLPVIHRTVS